MEIAVVLFFFGLSAGAVGKIKGSSFLIWFLIGLVLPGLGTLAAVLYRFEGKDPPRSCPECGNVMPIYQQVCNRCGRDLDFPAESPVSQQSVV
jgi:hypothetical protein